MPPRIAQHRRVRAPEESQEAPGVDHAAAGERQVVVVGGDALERPQLPRVVLAGEIGRRESRRPDPLDVPTVKVLVAGEREEAAIAVDDPGDARLRQLIALAHEARARAVLETAIAVADGGNREQIPREGARLPATPPNRSHCHWQIRVCAVKRRRFSSGCEPHPANAPAGSNRSSYGGNEMAEAFG